MQGTITFFLLLVPHLIASIPNDTESLANDVTRYFSVDTNSILAKTSDSFASVTIDVCALKLGLNFNDPLLIALSSHLAPAVLRIGGSDQNSFSYNMTNQDPMKPCKCKKNCIMTAPYWKQVNSFANITGLNLVFGLKPFDVDNALSLIQYTAQNKYPIFGYTYGNEHNGHEDQYAADLKKLRTAIDDLKVTQKPLLGGPDVATGRHSPLSDLDTDPTIKKALDWVKTFTEAAGKYLDMVTWHTYDFHSKEIGTVDHHPLQPSNVNTSRLWDPAYQAVADYIAANVSHIVTKKAPHAQIWLSETNSICHQGVYNATNSFINSLWLVNQMGMISKRGMPVMARQSLIGYNYSLLGNFPVDPIFPFPDYYTTILFQNVTSSVVLSANSTGDDRAIVYAYCHPSGTGAVTVTLINFHDDHSVKFMPGLAGPHEDYLLSPAAPKEEPYPFTSHYIALNGHRLEVDMKTGDLPTFLPIVSPENTPITLPSLTTAFVVYPEAGAEVCTHL